MNENAATGLPAGGRPACLLSVVSPVFRSRACVAPLCERITKAVSDLPGFTEHEIILVEDCGGDGSWEAIVEQARLDPHVRAIQLSRNFGQHHAITAGLDYCRGDWVVVLDCDLQDRPEEIPKLWAKAQEGFDVVCARRGLRRDPLGKRIMSRLFHVVFEWLSGLHYDPQVANFRIINRRVVDACLSMREAARGFSIQVHWLGFRTAYVDVTHAERHAGGTTYSMVKLLRLATDCILSYSNRPLRLTIWAGTSIFLCSVAAAAWILFRKLTWGIPVDGWTSLILSVWAFGGLIIANLGIIGLYLGRIYDETKRRPLYAVAREVNLARASTPPSRNP